MYKTIRIIQLVAFFVLYVMISNGQSNLNIKLNTFAYNLAEPLNSGDMKLALNNKGSIVFQPAINLSVEAFMYQKVLSFRLNQSFVLNPYLNLDGVSGISAHLRVYGKWKTAINVGIGGAMAYPLLINNADVGEVNNAPFITGLVEYNRFINKRTDLSIALAHAYSNHVSIAVGLRFWISKDIKIRRKCSTCPDFG